MAAPVAIELAGEGDAAGFPNHHDLGDGEDACSDDALLAPPSSAAAAAAAPSSASSSSSAAAAARGGGCDGDSCPAAVPGGRGRSGGGGAPAWCNTMTCAGAMQVLYLPAMFGL